MKIIPLDDQVTVVRVATIQLGYRFQQAIWHLLMMSDNGIFADPVERGHGLPVFQNRLQKAALHL